MEKFEINENGCLTAYHNDNKDVTEIIVPDGVKSIPDYAFVEYKKINSVTLPDSLENIADSAFWKSYLPPYETSVRSMTYRGVTFRPLFYMREVFEMIRDKDYSLMLSHKLKYPVILQIYFNDGDDVTTAYIKKNFKKFFTRLTDEIVFQSKCESKGLYFECIENVSEIMEKLIKCGKFITKRNIDTYVKLADEKECYEVFDMLEEYREENLT